MQKGQSTYSLVVRHEACVPTVPSQTQQHGLPNLLTTCNLRGKLRAVCQVRRLLPLGGVGWIAAALEHDLGIAFGSHELGQKCQYDNVHVRVLTQSEQTSDRRDWAGAVVDGYVVYGIGAEGIRGGGGRGHGLRALCYRRIAGVRGRGEVREWRGNGLGRVH